MEVEVDEKELKAAGAELFSDGCHGLRIHGWEIETRNRSILNSSTHELWEKKLETCHMPEMIFGESCLVLKHVKSGTTIHFNAFDALIGWKKEALPPVEVPAVNIFNFMDLLCDFRLDGMFTEGCIFESYNPFLNFSVNRPSEQVILDYDYTFTTLFGGSETTTLDADKGLRWRVGNGCDIKVFIDPWFPDVEGFRVSYKDGMNMSMLVSELITAEGEWDITRLEQVGTVK
ncbi:TIP41-like protein [Rosa rugosa]|uniref:TIP41-like protein n=1 Tax=Rosa rugosa TaxID=74645 RepID=UPI002B416E4E|nr:TIP41-like protein [Rosa rugosa]